MNGAIVDWTPSYHPQPPQKEGDEWESVITHARLGEWYETEDEDEALSPADDNNNKEDDKKDDFLQRWDALEDLLERRWKHLERVLKRSALPLQHSTFQQQIRDREVAVGNRKRLQLLEKEAKRVDRVKVKERLKKAGWDVDEASLLIAAKSKASMPSRVLDWLIYEVNTFVPALLGLLLHSIAMAGFFEIVQAPFQYVYSFATMALQSESVATRALVCAPFFIIGILTLRCTGYLYWWLNDRDFDCIKFDYHNRLRLSYRGARLLHSVRSNLLVRMIVYMLSYSVVYLTANEMYAIFPYVWGVPISHQLTNLPSASAIDHLLTTNGFACLLPCNQEIERRDAIDKMLLEADFEYTQEVLSWDCHVGYWLRYVYRHDFVSSLSKSEQTDRTWVGDLVQFALVMSVCLTLMRLCGFVFWKTY